MQKLWWEHGNSWKFFIWGNHNLSGLEHDDMVGWNMLIYVYIYYICLPLCFYAFTLTMWSGSLLKVCVFLLNTENFHQSKVISQLQTWNIRHTLKRNRSHTKTSTLNRVSKGYWKTVEENRSTFPAPSAGSVRFADGFTYLHRKMHGWGWPWILWWIAWWWGQIRPPD